MRAICIDDEALIMNYTVSLCRELKELDEVVGFTRALDALKYLEEHGADLALMDIDMPDMNGIVLAREMQARDPDIAIIFLTGYAQYALPAFELHAAGYLLKPVTRDKLAAEVAHALRGRLQDMQKRVIVRTFGNFELFADGRRVVFSRSKARELLAYLVDRQGYSVSRAEAFSVLWEEAVYDRSRQKQFDVVLRSLRTTLEEYDIACIMEVTRGKLRIVPEQIDCDMYRFLRGDARVIRMYAGEYMSSYAWGREREAMLYQAKSKEFTKEEE